MRSQCEGCGREWRVEATSERALMRCPYTDCRCSFLVQAVGDVLRIERARVFFRRRIRSLRAQFSRESVGAFDDARAVFAALSVVLSMLSVACLVSVKSAFFLTLAAFPLLFCVWNHQRFDRVLRVVYLLSILIVTSALTRSPAELFWALPEIVGELLSSALLIGVCSLFGWSLYRARCLFLAHRFAGRMLAQEKRSLASVTAVQTIPAIPYR